MPVGAFLQKKRRRGGESGKNQLGAFHKEEEHRSREHGNHSLSTLLLVFFCEKAPTVKTLKPG
jgi:hypothetical protein